MQPYPHNYLVRAAGGPSGTVLVSADGVVDIPTAPPPEFDGPGEVWSPETLLCASVANCFILTFRAIARASKFEWNDLSCRVEGVLERAEGGTQFTRFTTYATLLVPPGTDEAKARKLLEKAEHGCLVTKSLRGAQALVADVTYSG
jgi:organic hydroperoxide reductase OsmC/OhrA